MSTFQSCTKVIACFIAFFSCVNLWAAEAVRLDTFSGGMVGENLHYFQEQQQRLSVEQAMQQFTRGEATFSTSQSVSLGIGVNPVWLKIDISNDSSDNRQYRFAVETPWLDYIDAYIIRDGQVVEVISGGDAIPFEQRPMQYRYFAFETAFASGSTQVLFRVQTAGPMAIPIHLAEVEQARSRDIRQGYEYGVLYGIMLALGIYNLILFVMIRQPEFGLYAGYLFGFVANSLSYTGQIHAVFTPDYGALFQDWVDISLMVTYSVLGLHFARILLRTKSYAPRLDKITFWVANGFPLGMLFGALINSLMLSMLLAFILNTTFALLFIVLGYYALKARVQLAIFFFVSSVTAAVCICISTAAVAGLLPYNDVTFKLIEVGMAFEAMLLAVLLASRFRAAQKGQEMAEIYASTDDLTQLNNRRGFREKADVLWTNLVRYKRDLSIVLMDVDRFKIINDSFGHHMGDVALQQVAMRLKEIARSGDICARWGGEEFIVLLPETDYKQARFQAERLRKAIESEPVFTKDQDVYATVSIGIAGSLAGRFAGQDLEGLELEKMISKADEALYEAKESGRNQVRVFRTAPQATLF